MGFPSNNGVVAPIFSGAEGDVGLAGEQRQQVLGAEGWGIGPEDHYLTGTISKSRLQAVKHF